MAVEKSKERPLAKSMKAKRDDDIMLTNDSSIVSKRSVVKLYHSEQPDWFRPFVGKHQRRSPLINRGYWLRMRAVEHTVKQFLEEPSDRKKVVINLGCGYDPLPFIFLNKYPELSAKAAFVDVDYPPLMQKKRACIARDDELKEAYPFLKSGTSPSPDVWKAGPYLAVGCDLRRLSHLQRILEEEVRIHDAAVLFVAEVSVAYMEVKSADSVISWASYFNDARFCILEQTLPDGPNHPFARTMLNHFEKLHTHLKIVYEYPTLGAQKRRFLNFGWSRVKVQSLWDLWSDDAFLSAADRQALDAVEPFDEWEEFALFAGHYLLLVARTEAAATEEIKNVASSAESYKTTGSSVKARATLQILPQADGQTSYRRFGALFQTGHDFQNHGGYGAQTRLHDSDVYSAMGELKGSKELPEKLSLMCHTITNLNEHESLLVGGRTSPNRVTSECWLLTNQTYSRADDLSPARHRHCAASILIPVDGITEQGVLVFGGKTATGEVLQDWRFWSNERGWQLVNSSSPLPPPRFGASMAVFSGSSASGVLMGGMTVDGLVISDLWEWNLHWDNGAHITCRDRTEELGQSKSLEYGRFGANILPCPELGASSFLLIGGIARDRILKWEEETLALAVGESVSISKLDLPRPDGTRPLFVGTGAAIIEKDEILLVGGGAVCFSMGSFWNTTSSVLKINPASTGTTDPEADTKLCLEEQRQLETDSIGPEPIEVQHVKVGTQEEFESLVAKGQPAIMEGLDIGSCTQLWTPEYLRERIGSDRNVIVHSCPTDRMTFQTKNFSYLKQTFGEFIDQVTSGGKLYLRAIAEKQPAKQPTHLIKDFPSIADDFRLPAILSTVTEKMHSSPLRVSGPVTLWLHYDVLANVLCQIYGTKRLRLYPPSDVPQLSYPPGASSSNIDVYDPAPEVQQRLRHTHPHEAFMKPGDVLFLPPAWSHTARPEEGVSIAVNCFWRNLEATQYVVGRDVYGNRDIAAYEEGRKAVEKIAKSFEGVPNDLRGFYLERLIAELREKVEGTGGVH